MKIITLNINGVRAGARKGFFDWLQDQNADVVCLQETKAQVEQLQDSIFAPENYHVHYVDAEKKGYSGVALYCKQKPQQIITTLDHPIMDNEARYIQADFDGVSVVSLYLPSGSSSEERQDIKFQILDFYQALLKKQLEENREYIICGDWNIAHKNIDIKNWRGNQKNSGFLPEERAWLDTLFDDVGFVDAFREVNQEEAQYTWWSNRGRAWDNNVGWRIDYQIVTPGLKGKVKSAEIYKAQRFSDHAPLTMEYEL